MSDILRQEVAAAADPLVVKVGTRVLTGDDGTLDEDRIHRLAEELVAMMDAGRRVALVSSGAVGAGLARLELAGRPPSLAQLQAVAAVGQSRLIEVYDRALRLHQRHAAQVLLTVDDLNDRARYLNVRNTVLALFDYGALPIINENDTISVEELQISFGDNDRLAAMVTNLIRAPLLVLLSDVDGLYDGDPNDPASRVIETVTHLDEATMALARDGGAGQVSKGLGSTGQGGKSGASSRLGTGGMASKLAAARIATAAGENVIIASGRRPGVLADIIAGRSTGTLILADGQSVAARKRWIGFAARPCGQLKLDAGAQRAIEEQGRSLLAIGIVEVHGDFQKGDLVALTSPEGREFARGLTNYRADQVRQIAGHRTDEIAAILGHRPYDEVIHRDNLARS